MGDKMFEVGDYIVYGSNGVCEVKSVGPIDCPGVSSDKLYYTLCPLYIRDSRVFTPVDNDKVIMRGVMTKAEAEAFVDGINDIDALPINDEGRGNWNTRRPSVHVILSSLSESSKPLATE